MRQKSLKLPKVSIPRTHAGLTTTVDRIRVICSKVILASPENTLPRTMRRSGDKLEANHGLLGEEDNLDQMEAVEVQSTQHIKK